MPTMKRMIGRLLIGIVKGLLVGGLLGFALTWLGLGAPVWFIAYPAAALVGVLVGLIAGKPIWAADARIEAGLKAFVGALLGVGLMFAARKWLTMEVPVPLDVLGVMRPSLNEAAGASRSLGVVAITSLAMIAALLGGFYEADNDDAGAASQKSGAAGAASQKSATGGPRVALDEADELDEDEGAEQDKKQARK
jgi:hypothetical protein